LTVVSTSSKPADNAVSQSTVSNTKGVSKSGKSQQTNATNKDEDITPVTASSQVAKSTSVAKAKPSVKAAGKPAEAKAIKETNTTSQTQSASADALSHDKNDILDLVSTSALSTFTKRVDQFLFVLSAAHKLNADNFERVESIKGKNRTYFATSKEALLENGSSTNPKAIPDSAYWVVTNNNTAKKVSMLEQVLRQLGYTSEIISSVVARFSSEGK
jgi:negative modulator of initiation of replication